MKNATFEIGFVPGISPQAFDSMYTRIDICNLLQTAKCCRIKEEQTCFNNDMCFNLYDNIPYVEDENKNYDVYHMNANKPWPHVDGQIRLTEEEFNRYFYKLT
jgi:hypothetical protein